METDPFFCGQGCVHCTDRQGVCQGVPLCGFLWAFPPENVKKGLTRRARDDIIHSCQALLSRTSSHANVAQLVEQLIRNQQVKGSSPFIGSIFRGVAQFGSAFGSGPKGRRFKSCHLDQKEPETERFPVLFCLFCRTAPSLALFSCNGCATLGKGPKTCSGIPIVSALFPIFKH